MNKNIKDKELYDLLLKVVSEGICKAIESKNKRTLFLPREFDYPSLSKFDITGFPSLGKEYREEKIPINYASFFERYGGKEAEIQIESLECYEEYYEYATQNEYFIKRFKLDSDPYDFYGGYIKRIVKDLINRYLVLFGEEDPFDEELFNMIYSPIEFALTEEELPIEIHIPILFVDFPFDNYKVSDNIYIKKMSNQMHKSRYNIKDYSRNVPSALLSSATHSLVLKNFSSENNHYHKYSSIFYRPEAYPNTLINKFFNAMRIVNGIKTGYCQLISLPTGWTYRYDSDLIPIFGTSVREYPSEFENYRWLQPIKMLTTEEVDQIRDFFVGLIDVSDKKIEHALYRLKECYLRKNEEDAIIDAMIALETLLTDGDRGEITHKLSLRAAFLLQQSPFIKDTPLDIFKNLKAIYAYRSAIVHGSAKVQNKREIKINEEVKVPALEIAIEYLRNAILVLVQFPKFLKSQNIDEDLILTSN